MGLDQYLEGEEEGKDNIELGYWRKQYELNKVLGKFGAKAKDPDNFELYDTNIYELLKFFKENGDNTNLVVFSNALTWKKAKFGRKLIYVQNY